MKTILLFVMVLASTFGAAAQGFILFGNSPVASTKISTNGYDGGPAQGLTAAAPNAFYYALFYSTNATTVHGATNAVITDGSGNTSGIFVFDDANWKLAAYGTNSPSVAGGFSSAAQNADGSTTVPGVLGLATANFVVLGWAANMGSTVAAMENSLLHALTFDPRIGESAVSGPIQLGDGALLPAPGLFGTGFSQIPGFVIGAVTIPEPSTLALAAVGLAGLIFFRRRNDSSTKTILLLVMVLASTFGAQAQGTIDFF